MEMTIKEIQVKDVITKPNLPACTSCLPASPEVKFHHMRLSVKTGRP